MRRGTLDDLAAFARVASTRSFTRAAAELGLSRKRSATLFGGWRNASESGCSRVLRAAAVRVLAE